MYKERTTSMDPAFREEICRLLGADKFEQYGYVGDSSVLNNFSNNRYVEPKRLAGETTHDIRPMMWWVNPDIAVDPTVHGPIENGRTFCLVIHKDEFPAIEMGGSEISPVLRPNVNVVPGPGTDILHDLNNPFPMQSETYGFVYSRFTIEHIKNSRIKQFISECYRITKPGGVNIHIAPNLKAQCDAMAKLDRWAHHDVQIIFAGTEDPQTPDPWEGYHHTGFSPELAIELFQEAGFSEVIIWEYPRYFLEMVIEAWK